MSVDLIFKIAGIGIIVSIMHTVLKQANKEDLAHVVTLTAVVVVLAVVAKLVSDLFGSVRTMFQLP
ncbi:MAG: stage III sporulation protein AC [Bacillota bacterium]